MRKQPYKFEMGDRVKLKRDEMGFYPASGRGEIVRRYLAGSASGIPEYVVRFDHDKPWDNDWDVNESLLEKENPLP